MSSQHIASCKTPLTNITEICLKMSDFSENHFFPHQYLNTFLNPNCLPCLMTLQVWICVCLPCALQVCKNSIKLKRNCPQSPTYLSCRLNICPQMGHTYERSFFPSMLVLQGDEQGGGEGLGGNFFSVLTTTGGGLLGLFCSWVLLDWSNICWREANGNCGG